MIRLKDGNGMSHTPRQRPWLELYGARPKDATTDFSSVLSAFRAGAKSSAIAIHCFGSPLSYRWLDERSDELAAWLADDIKIARGERIAIILQNVPESSLRRLLHGNRVPYPCR